MLVTLLRPTQPAHRQTHIQQSLLTELIRPHPIHPFDSKSSHRSSKGEKISFIRSLLQPNRIDMFKLYSSAIISHPHNPRGGERTTDPQRLIPNMFQRPILQPRPSNIHPILPPILSPCISQQQRQNHITRHRRHKKFRDSGFPSNHGEIYLLAPKRKRGPNQTKKPREKKSSRHRRR